MRHWSNSRMNTGIVDRFAFILVKSCNTDWAEVVLWLTPNKRNSKSQRLPGTWSLLFHVFQTCLANNVRGPWSVLITKLDLKVSTIGFLVKVRYLFLVGFRGLDHFASARWNHVIWYQYLGLKKNTSWLSFYVTLCVFTLRYFDLVLCCTETPKTDSSKRWKESLRWFCFIAS